MPPDNSRGNRSAAARRPTACNFISTKRRITGLGRSVCVCSGRPTFSATVRSVSRPLPCSSTPTPLRISSNGFLVCGTGLPNTSTSPAAGTSSPVSAASRVDLPLPLGPSTAVMLPRGTSSEMSRSTARPPRSRRTSARRTMGVASVIRRSDLYLRIGRARRKGAQLGVRRLNRVIAMALSQGRHRIVRLRYCLNAPPRAAKIGCGALRSSFRHERVYSREMAVPGIAFGSSRATVSGAV